MEDSDNDDFMNESENYIPRLPPVVSSSDDDSSDDLPSLLPVKSSRLDSHKTKEGGVTKKELKPRPKFNLAQVKRRLSEINKLRDIDRKCVDILGKENVLEQTEKIIKNHELITCTETPPLTPDQLLSLNTDSTGQETISLSPDLKLFVHPIMYMDDITPPLALKKCKSITFLPEGSIDSSQGLRDLVVNKLLLLAFRSEPCPTDVLFWLLEISCLSRDVLTRISAFSILLQLLKNSGLIMESTSTIYYHRIVSLLVKLGIKNEANLTTFESTTEQESMNVYSDKDIDMIQSSVNFITKFITFINEMGHIKNNHEQYVPILLNLALDRTICQSLVTCYITTCLGTIAVSVEGFEKIEEIYFNAMRVYAYSGLHYHYCVYLLQLIPVSSPSLRNMQRRLIRFVLKSLTLISNDDSTITDVQVLQSVVNHYLQLDTKTYDYKQLYAVMTVLAMLVKQPDMNWPSLEAKSSFIDDLNYLGTKKIKETVSQAMEGGMVKGLITCLKLDLDQELQENSRQTNLFDFFVEQSSQEN